MKNRRFQRLKWGLIFAGLYLLVSVPCAVVYRMHRHEHSISMLIVSHASFPVRFMMVGVLRPFTAQIERWPHGEIWFLSILLGMTTLLYLFLGQSLGWVVRTTASFFSRQRERMDI
jgi:hypothetical protein